MVIALRPIPRNLILTLAVAALALSSWACNAAGSRFPVPSHTVSPSAEGLQSFKDKWRNLSIATPNGPFTITFSEVELTSAVDAALQEAQADGESVPVENLQVFLRDGTITVYGQVHYDPLTVTGQVGLVPSITSDGLVALTPASVDFGPLEVDEAVLDGLVARLERSINEPIQSSPLKIALSDIIVADGQITIIGTITP